MKSPNVSLDKLVRLSQASFLSLRAVRLGIAARLTMSFAVVALLAAAANLLAVEGTAIIRTMRTGGAPPAAAAKASVPPVDVPIAKPVPAASEPSGAKKLSADLLVLAVDRFERAAQERVELSMPGADEKLLAIRAELEQAATQFGVAAKEVLGKPVARIDQTTQLLIAAGLENVRIADSRRAVLGEFHTRFEAMNERVKNSVDRAWKIFGRVVARQSLIQLNASLDEIRRRAACLNVLEGCDGSGMEFLAVGEKAFSDILEKNAQSFARTDGGAWLQDMREDYARLTELQSRLQELDHERRDNEARLTQTHSELTSILNRAISNQNAGKAAASKGGSTGKARASVVFKTSEKTSAPFGATQQSTLPGLATPLSAISAAPTLPVIVTTTTVPQDNAYRPLVAWLSLGTLLLLIVISAFTVRSIVVPVRQLLKATKRIAAGEAPDQLPRGGIRELDTLAVAFNAMSEKLAMANEITRNYQLQLEAKVDERTRQLQLIAEQDALTGLPNRRHLFALLRSAIETAQASGRKVGVFFVDIDNFKTLNDSLGHAFGDSVLVAIAERLTQKAREFGYAARLGGDEFTIICAEASNFEAIAAAGRALVQAFSEPLRVAEREVHVSVSVGVSVYPDHDREPESLLRAADAALFRAKSLGRNQLSMFTPDLVQLAAERFKTEQGLRRAIERGEFELVFQPELSTQTMETGLVEALIRWRRPDGILAAPGEFLGIAEETGLIMEIGDWVLRAAIKAAASWHYGSWPDVRVAINVSPRQLLDPHFVDKVLGLLREYRLPARCIEIELTETVLQTGAGTIDILRSLRANGIAVALDDFGTGYSSLASLEHLPFTRIKLDRSLIAEIDTNARSAAIASAIVTLCQDLELDVTAEGIERPEQFSLLLECGDIYMQGYLLSRPVAADQVVPTMRALAQQAQEWLLSAKSKATVLKRSEQAGAAAVDNASYPSSKSVA